VTDTDRSRVTDTEQVASLACPACEATYRDRWRCACGAPLEYADSLEIAEASADTLAGDDSPFDELSPETLADDRSPHAGLWRYAALLLESPLVTLGEGGTPLVDAPAWDAQFKLEYTFPTGSFKDRGATATLSRAAALGVSGGCQGVETDRDQTCGWGAGSR
jgi:threonine synthase